MIGTVLFMLWTHYTLCKLPYLYRKQLACTVCRYAAAVNLQPDPSGKTCTTTDFQSDVIDLRRDARNTNDLTTTGLFNS